MVTLPSGSFGSDDVTEHLIAIDINIGEIRTKDQHSIRRKISHFDYQTRTVLAHIHNSSVRFKSRTPKLSQQVEKFGDSMADTASYIHERFHRFMHGINERYEPFIRQHLSKVYMVLASTTAASAVGALFQMRGSFDMGVLAALASLVLVLGLHFYKDNGKNYYARLSMLYAFGFCSGQTLGPLLDYICSINPAIILTALMGTFIIFGTLSLAALLAEQGKYLYLGGMLVSVINCMALLSLFNMIFKSYFVQITQLYVGVFVMAAFIVYDTQNIVDKCRMGNRDVVQHALDLFFDVLSMFRRLLIILTQKEEQRQNDRRKKKP